MTFGIRDWELQKAWNAHGIKTRRSKITGLLKNEELRFTVICEGNENDGAATTSVAKSQNESSLVHAPEISKEIIFPASL